MPAIIKEFKLMENIDESSKKCLKTFIDTLQSNANANEIDNTLS
jgi:hypothetical protein